MRYRIYVRGRKTLGFGKIIDRLFYTTDSASEAVYTAKALARRVYMIGLWVKGSKVTDTTTGEDALVLKR